MLEVVGRGMKSNIWTYDDDEEGEASACKEIVPLLPEMYIPLAVSIIVQEEATISQSPPWPRSAQLWHKILKLGLLKGSHLVNCMIRIY